MENGSEMENPESPTPVAGGHGPAHGPLASEGRLREGQLRFEAEPDWDALPDEIPSTEVARILHVHRKTLTKYVQIGKLKAPVAHGDNWSKYAKGDVIGFWRTRQYRIAQGYIPLPGRLPDDWGGVDGGEIDPATQGPSAEGTLGLTPASPAGPVPGGGVETHPYAGPTPVPQADKDLVPGEALVSLSREGFRELMVAVYEQAQAPLLKRLEESETQIAALDGQIAALQTGQREIIDAQRRFLEAQAEAQRQNGELVRQLTAGQQAMLQEQRRLAGQVARLTEALQTQAERDEDERRRAEAEPQGAWERFKRGLGLGGGQRQNGTQKRGG